MATSRKVFQNKAETLVAEHEIDALSTTPESLSTSSCRLQWIRVDNSLSGAVVYIKLYNKAAAPVHATDDPDMILYAPAGFVGAIQIVPAGSSAGLLFSLGLHLCASDGKTKTGSAPSPEPDLSVGII